MMYNFLEEKIRTAVLLFRQTEKRLTGLTTGPRAWNCNGNFLRPTWEKIRKTRGENETKRNTCGNG